MVSSEWKETMGEHFGDQLFDLIIVGAGIMGSATAYEAAKLGKKVLLFEQFDLLHCLGSSHGESRTIRATYPESYYPPMVLESFRLWESAQSAAGYRVLVPTPQLDLGPGHNLSLQFSIRNCGPNFVDAKVFDANPQLSEEFSGAFRLPEGWLAVSTPLGGVIKPTKAVAMFQSLALHHGAVIKDRTQVVSIEPRYPQSRGIRISIADGGDYYANKVVITAGAWTRKLIEQVTGGKTLPIQPLHTFIWYWKIKDGYESAMSASGGFPTFASYGVPYIYGTPSMEFPGLIKIALHGGRACDPDLRDWSGDGGEMVSQVADWIERVIPDRIVTSGGPVITQACMYSMTPDEDYVIDFIGGEFGKDVVVAGGFSGHGFKMGPLVGKILVEMAFDGEATTATRIGVDVTALFGLGRFAENSKGNVKEFEDQVV